MPFVTQPIQPALRRELGLVDATLVGVGAILGAGLFVVTGQAAQIAGPSLLLGLMIAGVAAGCNALSSAELAAAYPKAGGAYEYGYEKLHPLAGFAAGWLFCVSKLAAGGVVALTFAMYLPEVVGSFGGVPASFVAAFLAVCLTVANLFGIRKAGRLNAVIVAVTVGAILYFVAGTLPRLQTNAFVPFAPGGLPGVLQSAALLFFAFTGYARIATLGEEVRDPQKTIPRAIILALSIASFLYLLACVSMVGVMGKELLPATGPRKYGGTAIFVAAHYSGLAGAVQILSLGAVTATAGVLLSQLLGVSRVLLAMGRRGDMPPVFAYISNASGVPFVGVLFCGAVVVSLALLGTLKVITASATFAILLYYAVANLAALRLTGEQKRFPRVVAYVGLGACILLAASLPLPVIASGCLLLAVGFAFRFAMRRVFPANGTISA
ncbi:MAG: amino acid permease [Akkermansiaceae bacterium]|nr:amino acid permease [Armatimonadota bacterium]